MLQQLKKITFWCVEHVRNVQRVLDIHMPFFELIYCPINSINFQSMSTNIKYYKLRSEHVKKFDLKLIVAEQANFREVYWGN